MASHSQPIVILLPTGSLPNRWLIGANRTNLEIKTKYICKISKIDILLQSTRTTNTARNQVQIHQSKIKQVIFEATNTKAPNIHNQVILGQSVKEARHRETLRLFVPTIADDCAPQKRLLAIFWFNFFNVM